MYWAVKNPLVAELFPGTRTIQVDLANQYLHKCTTCRCLQWPLPTSQKTKSTFKRDCASWVSQSTMHEPADYDWQPTPVLYTPPPVLLDSDRTAWSPSRSKWSPIGLIPLYHTSLWSLFSWWSPIGLQWESEWTVLSTIQLWICHKLNHWLSTVCLT